MLCCVFCWMRGELLPEGHRVRTPAVMVVAGVSVCDNDLHIQAAMQNSIRGGLQFIDKAVEMMRAGASPPGPPDDQNHTGLGDLPTLTTKRVKGPNED